MATVTASILTTDPVVSNTSPIRLRLQFSEGFSFSHSDITVLNGRNIRLTQVGQSQVSYYREYWFLTQTHENAPGYARFFLAADAVTPNLDEDLDFFIYWDSDLEANISLASALPDGAISIPEITRLWWLGPVSGGALVDVRMTLSHDARFFDANDFTVTGDATAVDSTAVYGGNDYWLLRVRLPSSLGNGGSFRMVLNDIHACYPSISQTFDRTFRWNSSGYVSSINTADIPAVLTMSISETYIAISEDLTVTFNFDIDVTGFTASDISVTTGITKGAFTQVSARQYTLVITTPASGNGEGVVSLAANRVTPGNNNASVRFTYIDRIDADISLSAAAAQNGETVLAQFDFDYDVPNFESSFVTLSDANASVGEAIGVGDENRCWVVPVALPQQGEGNLEISLEEDEIGFGQDRVAGQVQFAPTINLNIALQDNLKLLAVINKDFKHDISITGNNISSVDVVGLLRPFYHQWSASTGTLSILGKPDAYYKDLEFTVVAIDRDDTTRASASIDVIDVAPSIVVPARPLRVAAGVENSLEVIINNSPTQIEVEGSWIGLDHGVSERGVMISGEVPASGLGITGGNLSIDAENSGGSALRSSVPWVISSPIIGDFDQLQFRLPSLGTIYREVGNTEDIYLTDYTNSVPTPSFTPWSSPNPIGRQFSLPDGIVFDQENARLFGTYTTAGSYSLFFTMENDSGLKVVGSGVTVVAAGTITIPNYVGPEDLGVRAIAVGDSSRGQFDRYLFLTQNNGLDPNMFSSVILPRLSYPWRAGHYRILGLESYPALYQHYGIEPDFRDNSPLQFRSVSNINGNHRRLNEGFFNCLFYNGNRPGFNRSNFAGDYRIRIEQFTSMGSAITPEFTLRLG